MITFFSNFINEHQIPFCQAMYDKTNGNFRFVATEQISKERLNMKFVDKSDEFPFVVKSYENDEQYKKALDLGNSSDVVIIGSAPDVFIEERLKQNKLTFRYYERFFKQGKWRILDPRVLRCRYLNDTRHRNKNLHMLCASAYTAPDCRFIFSYPNKTYKWGYFPPIKEYGDIDEVIKNKRKNSILWVGRQIGWKHPENMIYLAEFLKKQGIDFRIEMVGQGPLENKLKKEISKRGLDDCIKMTGFVSPEEVRNKMERADIFVFTSDQNEGWGAVLNESMNSACAVVANRQIGSVPYLLENGENGLIYNKSKKKMAECVKTLLTDSDKKKKLQENAYKALTDTWNAHCAAQRLLELIEDIENGKEPRYKDGPCSRD